MATSYVPSYKDLEVSFSTSGSKAPSKATVHWVEAGDSTRPPILLLHGFPASSHQYRDLIPMLSDSYHVLAPDYPGSGLSTASDDFVYSFENVTLVIAAWLRAIGISEAAIFIQDFGAPVGLRLAITGALKPTAIITQNGNAYVEGLGEAAWAPLKAYWESGSQDIRGKIGEALFNLEATKGQYVGGTPEKDLHLLNPLAWTHDYLQNLDGPVNRSRQLDMLYDYRKNVELYPEFQKYIRDSKVRILAVWGKGDAFFIPPGAEAFRKDAPDAQVHIIDAGHFALESARWEIVEKMRKFLTEIGY